MFILHVRVLRLDNVKLFFGSICARFVNETYAKVLIVMIVLYKYTVLGFGNSEIQLLNKK